MDTSKSDYRADVLKILTQMKQKYLSEGFLLRGLFGSIARGDFDESSDIDLAYELEKEVFLKNHTGFEAVSRVAEISIELQAVFGRKVDLVSLNSANSILIDEINKELINA